ncbi:putative g-patch domain-containing protein [Phaeoacremonium minimum UCRPA7]|uniref:Protein SQS1 n=1 Tax=Phaeoacremonium minimum (strain UCR-PA7) TaxID=1286976 RepID=R8BTD7_PHAM7|nr:putative g-patch domain-containing protein [Phaeoacremonium minimum UCRPA7]EOO02569.1 putative g-patch domain-containing protein [Phaeoacremonium minimum UCRPA7]
MPRSKKSGRAAKAARFRAAASTGTRPRNEAIAASVLHKITDTHDFSMRDEARNTAHSHNTWGQDAKLRARPVAFISAGLIEPLKDLSLDSSGGEADPDRLKSHDKQPNLNLEPPRQKQTTNSDLTADVAGQVLAENAIVGPTPAIDPPQEMFFIDKTGDKNLSAGTNLKFTSPRPASPGESTDSSEEIILFKGRNMTRPTDRSDIIHDEISIQIESVTNQIEHTSLTKDRIDAHHVQGLEALHSDLQTQQDEEDAIIADYIANMAEADAAADDDDEVDEIAPQEPIFNMRDLGAPDGEAAFGDASNDDDAIDKLLPSDGCSSLSSSDDDVGDEEDDDDAEGDLEGKSPVDQVDDEELARIIAKQEELGLGGDEVLLFSAEHTAGSGPSYGRPRRRKGSSLAHMAQAKSTGRSVPSASALADAFDEFDLMDWGRSNPQLKAKGKRGQITFDVSDSELDSALQEAWQKDRATKKEKKRAREQLRAQGFLGSKANPEDPRTKYQDGMSMEDIKGELRAFLLSSDTTLALPPMDASARKLIHEIANKFKIKSKSAGSGDQRRPALYRTKNTMRYTEYSFEQAFARVGRRYFPRLDGTGKTPKRTGGSGRVNHAAVTYRDGEVVGASAPELGESNKGRNMLEKMGWSSGMGLGATDNKGILQPVVHVVKRSKAGLG